MIHKHFFPASSPSENKPQCQQTAGAPDTEVTQSQHNTYLPKSQPFLDQLTKFSEWLTKQADQTLLNDLITLVVAGI
jgi:hypothetical protein